MYSTFTPLAQLFTILHRMHTILLYLRSILAGAAKYNSKISRLYRNKIFELLYTVRQPVIRKSFFTSNRGDEREMAFWIFIRDYCDAHTEKYVHYTPPSPSASYMWIPIEDTRVRIIDVHFISDLFWSPAGIRNSIFLPSFAKNKKLFCASEFYQEKQQPE